MPTLPVVVQPGTRTLVNVPTILSTSPRAVNTTVDLLGHEITVEATATSYRWDHGDGSAQTTSRPGRPWPAKDVTHTYRTTADAVSIQLSTSWTVRYRVDDGPWTPLGETLSTTSAPVSLEVAEAAPVLTAP